MTILPGLTSTKKERIPAFLDDMRRFGVLEIALFPTCLSADERRALYRELEKIGGVRIPHVHLRSDCYPGEIDYLSTTFGVEAFNIHPRASTHPFADIPREYAARFFVENVDMPADEAELDGSAGPALGGLCPDFSHLENARLYGRRDYVDATERLLARFPVGCCHLSAIRIGVPNEWAGEWDHHAFSSLSDLDYLSRYRAFMPAAWGSLELENPLAEQLEAAAYLAGLLTLPDAAVPSAASNVSAVRDVRNLRSPAGARLP
jgi:hypothetical protein